MAKKLGGKKGLRLTDDELALWTSLSIDVQKQISQFKFDTYPQVRDDLLKSAGKILVHPAMRCSPRNASGKASLTGLSWALIISAIFGCIFVIIFKLFNIIIANHIKFFTCILLVFTCPPCYVPQLVLSTSHIS